MALEKQVVIDKIEVSEFGQIRVRQATRIIEDGKVISTSFHRHGLTPGDDTDGQDQRVQDIASVIWTPEVISKFK